MSVKTRSSGCLATVRCFKVCYAHSELRKEKVAVGDIIYIEAATGQVRRVGRSEEFAGQFDLEADKYIPVPKGDVHKKKEVIQVIALLARRCTFT